MPCMLCAWHGADATPPAPRGGATTAAAAAAERLRQACVICLGLLFGWWWWFLLRAFGSFLSCRPCLAWSRRASERTNQGCRYPPSVTIRKMQKPRQANDGGRRGRKRDGRAYLIVVLLLGWAGLGLGRCW
ncbi:hypothetical protein IWX90DRAFT_8759 [Phyllosticta citrichinensis]|uniref:Uncharacterized protein n=1 Tax=Phyllosticta citrichinensis TaxID=1130410 RepID=A0ABR1Y5T8_9PEZI